MSKLLKPRKLGGNLLVLALLGLWYLTLAPTAFGGPAAYVEVSGHSMDGTYKSGDLILTQAQDGYAIGDIVTYKVNGNQQVIHRIIGGDGTKGYTMQGDNNPDPDPWHPTDVDVVGKAWHRFEGKAWLLHLPQRPWFVGVAAGVLTLIMLGLDAVPRRRTSVNEQVTRTGAGVAAGSPAEEPLGMEMPLIPVQRGDSAPAASRATWRSRLDLSPDPDGGQSPDQPSQTRAGRP